MDRFLKTGSISGIVIYTVVSIICFVSCARQDVSIDSLVVSPISSSVVVDEIGTYIDDVKLIPISAQTEVFSSISKLIPYGTDYLILSGGVVYSVSNDGSLVRRVGKTGRGPGEYLMVKDIALNCSQDELWCLDVSNMLLAFDSETLDFIRSVKPMNTDEYARAIIPGDGNSFFLFFPNPLSSELNDESTSFSCIKQFDATGRIVKMGHEWDGFIVDAAFSSPVSFSDGKYILSPGTSMPGVVFNDGVEEYSLTFDFGRHTVPKNFFDGNIASPWERVSELFEKDYYKLVSSVYSFGNDIYFRAFGKQSSLWNFILSRDSSRGIRWQSIGSNTVPISAIGVQDGYLIFPYDDYGYNTLDEEKDPLKSYIIGEYGLPDESRDINTYLIKVKFNEF